MADGFTPATRAISASAPPASLARRTRGSLHRRQLTVRAGVVRRSESVIPAAAGIQARIACGHQRARRGSANGPGTGSEAG